MGPDLSCFFQDVETEELVLLVLQSKLSQTFKAEIVLRAIESVDPQFFYTVEVCTKHPSMPPLIFYFCIILIYRTTAAGSNMHRQSIRV